MGCTPIGYKTFLVCCNVALLFIGMSVLILGVKMKQLLSALLLIDVAVVAQAVEAIVATGFFISVAGITGITGACYEALWLIIVHLVSLGVIVIMEFGLGVTLLVVKKTVENYIGTADCNKNCAATLDTLVLDYALPSAGLMMTIIIVEALMIYSAIKLYFYIRDSPKLLESPGTNVAIQNVQMRNVPHSPFPVTPHPMYIPEMDYLMNQATPTYPRQPSPTQYAVPPASPKPPQYTQMLPDHEQPPGYAEAVHRTFGSPSVAPKPELQRTASFNSV